MKSFDKKYLNDNYSEVTRSTKSIICNNTNIDYALLKRNGTHDEYIVILTKNIDMTDMGMGIFQTTIKCVQFGHSEHEAIRYALKKYTNADLIGFRVGKDFKLSNYES